MKKVFDYVCRINFRRFAGFCILLTLMGADLHAAGRKNIETVTIEGEEIWQHDFDVSERKKGIYNYIVTATDRAGNESVSGPFNIRIDPNAGLPVARIVYPENNSIIRQNINLLGVASGRFGVDKVAVRLNGGDFVDVNGTEYWNQQIDFSNVPDGRHVLFVQAFDSKGTPGPVHSVQFILDTSPPVIELSSHKVGDILSGTVRISGKASDPSGISSLGYSDDGVTFRPLPGRRRGSDSVEFSVSFNTRRMPDGPLLYFIRAVDNTGAANTLPYLFFINNNGPELEVFTPAEGENIYGNFVLSGRVYSSVGIEKLTYEWGRVTGEIETRPGDPFWSVPLSAGPRTARSIRVTAVDKAGNATSVNRRTEDRVRGGRNLTIVIDYPPPEILRAMPANMAIYGRIEPAAAARSVTIGDNPELIDAMPSFRIDPQMIPAGRANLVINPRGQGRNPENRPGGGRNTEERQGERNPDERPAGRNREGRQAEGGNPEDRPAASQPLSVRITKAVLSTPVLSQITVTSPEKYSWHSGSTFTLSGTTTQGQLQYRLHPADEWQPLRTEGGGFTAQINIADRSEGPLHLELRTGGEEFLPVYHPVNKAAAAPVIQFINPTPANGEIQGNVTVTGSIEHTVPLQSVTYSVDGTNFNDITVVSRFDKSWFSYFCNFTTLNETGNKLVIRVVDAAGNTVEASPECTVSSKPIIPTIIVNTPVDNGIITQSFEISGVAFGDIGVQGVHWRILGPYLESISSSPAGRVAREAAEAFTENQDVPFKELLTNQSFQIPVDFTMITDGEFIVEVYAADPYGVRSEIISRNIKISTAPPDTRITEPAITQYSKGMIKLRGLSDDANGITSVSVSMDNGNTYQEAVLLDDGIWELALNTAAYRDGNYSALIRSEDNYGITSFTSAMVNVDNTPPELFISYPLNGQLVNNNFHITGRVSDNISVKSLEIQIISAENPEHQLSFDIQPQLVFLEKVDFGDFPQGEYIVRISASDLADNVTIVSRKVNFDADDKAAQIALFSPMPGEERTGPVNIIGHITGSFLPDDVQIIINNNPVARAEVNRYGYFYHIVEEDILTEEGIYRFSATYNSATGTVVSSPNHSVYYSPFGPMLSIESHNDGDVITGRPWLEGRALYNPPAQTEGESGRMNRRDRAALAIQRIIVSYDNGRSFQNAQTAGNNWKFRLETSMLTVGSQPVVIKAEFANGESTVRRIMLHVDTTPPIVETIGPTERSTHRDNIVIYGTANDNMELANVEISLRPNHKMFYSVPTALQGLYFDTKVFGATYFDVGIGLSLFNDNVRFQGQYGKAPPDGAPHGGRYVGDVFGIKLLANIFTLPFDYLFGPDWAFYSMSFAVGANFSWFSMDENRSPLYMGAIVAQWDFANIDMKFFNPNWKYFRNYAFYLQPEFWFISSDVQATTEIRMTIGARINFF